MGRFLTSFRQFLRRFGTKPQSSPAPVGFLGTPKPRDPRAGRGEARVPAGAIRVEYAVERDGAPDPGEVVWGWVPFEDDPSQGKDRPVLLLGRRGQQWAGLMLTSKDHTRGPGATDRYGRTWMDVGTGGWDRQGRESEVRLDRLILLDDGAVRREGAALDRPVFDRVVAAAARFHAFV